MIERLANRGRQPQRLAWVIDHTHCLTRRDGGGFAARPDASDNVKNDKVFGLFPGFRPLITEASTQPWITALRAVADDDIRTIVAAVPSHWDVAVDQRDALHRLITVRRDYLIAHWRSLFAPACGWQDGLTELTPEEH